MQDAFNAQITAELWSSNLYLETALWFRKEGCSIAQLDATLGQRK